MNDTGIRDTGAFGPRAAPGRCAVAQLEEGVVIITLHGALDHAGAAAMGNEVRWAVTTAHRSVVIDCAGVGFVDSTGLRLLVEAESMAACQSEHFVLHNVPRQLRNLLQISGLDQSMTTAT